MFELEFSLDIHCNFVLVQLLQLPNKVHPVLFFHEFDADHILLSGYSSIQELFDAIIERGSNILVPELLLEVGGAAVAEVLMRLTEVGLRTHEQVTALLLNVFVSPVLLQVLDRHVHFDGQEVEASQLLLLLHLRFFKS